MKTILVLAVIVSVVCVGWTYAFITLGIPLWASFLGAASYFAGGGNKTGLLKALPSGLLGIVVALGTVFLATKVLAGGLLTLSLVVGVAGFIVITITRIGFFDFIPGTFVGYATTFAIMAAFPTSSLSEQGIKAAIGLVAGIAVGYLIHVVNSALSPRLVGK